LTMFSASVASSAPITSKWLCGAGSYSNTACWDPQLGLAPYNRGTVAFNIIIPAGSGTIIMDLDVAGCAEVNTFFLGEGRTFKVAAGKCYQVIGQADIGGVIWGNGGDFIAPSATFPGCKAQVWVDGGATVRLLAPIYCATGLNQTHTNYTLFSSDGLASMLDLSAMVELNDAVIIPGATFEHNIVAQNGGVIDLSGLKKIIGPYAEECLTITAKSGGSVRLDRLAEIVHAGGAGRILFKVDGETTLALPSLASVSDTTFHTTNRATLKADGSPFTYSATGLNQTHTNYTLLSSEGPGSMLGLSAMVELNDAVIIPGATYEHSIVAQNGGVIDLSGLKKIIGPAAEERLQVRAVGGAIDMSSLETIVESSGTVLFLLNDGGQLSLGNVYANKATEIMLNNPNDVLIARSGLNLGTTIMISNPGNGSLILGGNLAYAHKDETKVSFGKSYVFVSGDGPQELEVGGLDMDVFWQELANDNFGFGQMVVGGSNQPGVVFLVDEVDNGNRAGLTGYEEALYLFGKDGQNGLRLLSGSRLYMGRLPVYAMLNGEMTDLRTLFGPGEVEIPFDEGYLCLDKPRVDDPSNLVRNGGFETGVNPPAAGAGNCIRMLAEGATDIDDWRVGQDAIEWTHESCFPDGGAGERIVDLNSYGPAADDDDGSTVPTIQQTVSTVPGSLYHVWFDTSAGLDPDAAPRTLTVSAAGQFEEFPFDGTTPADWRTRTWRFRATDVTTTLTFAVTSHAQIDPSVRPGRAGVAIDNVVLFGASAEPCSLRVSTSPGGSVMVSPDGGEPAGIAAATEETFIFECGTDVSLTAQPAAGYRFTGWTGLTPTEIIEGAVDSNAVTVHVDHPVVVKAVFKNLVVAINSIDTSNCPTIEATVMVADVAGNLVEGLDWLNFMVYEDGVQQEPISVTPRTEPVAVALCLDFSGSMESDHERPLQQTKENATRFVERMKEGTDLAEIIKFARGVELTQELGFTTDKQRLIDAIALPIGYPDDATHLYDALWLGVGDTAEQPVTKKAVIVISDGGDRGSVRTKGAVIELAQSNGIPVHAIGLGLLADQQVLQDIASATGGLYYYAPAPEDLGNIWLAISGQLQGQYVVSYGTTRCGTSGGAHELRIEVNVDVRSDSATQQFTCPDACIQP
jgi:Ca-activated chloride channel family protein